MRASQDKFTANRVLNRVSGVLVLGERRADPVAERCVLRGETSEAGVRGTLYDVGSLDGLAVDELLAGEIDFLSARKLVPEVDALPGAVGVEHLGDRAQTQQAAGCRSTGPVHAEPGGSSD
jgi:hypothetical protein